MRLHLVGGFLGSGKTTAIVGAAKLLMAQGKRVGVITNDQGKYLVDTAFFQLENVPTVEVTGGCFCCHYEDLDARLDSLIAQVQPDVIFAESVGSCADVVATVIRPLSSLRATHASLSVLADARLLRRRLLNLPMPFSDDIVYIFDQQIAEAGMLIINKRDLLTSEQRHELEVLVRDHYTDLPYRFQDSRSQADLAAWIDELDRGAAAARMLDIDYARYGAGEAELGWLNARYTLVVSPGTGRQVAVDVLAGIIEAVRVHGWAIGHLKFVVEGSSSDAAKISIPTLEEGDWRAGVPELSGERVSLLINARVQADAAALRDLVHEAIAARADSCGISWEPGEIEAFQPAPPRPTHRFSS